MAARKRNPRVASTSRDKEAKGPSEDEKIVQEAHERFARCEAFEQTARGRFVEDVKFYNGDSDNGYQWPQNIRKARDLDDRPCLTINKTRQYCLNITNDAKQNKPSVKVKPVGNTATYEGSQVMEGIVRRIEYQSRAQAVYDKANASQVQGGWGCWRIVTRYADGDSFNQEIFIEGFRDPLSVYQDPDAAQPDRSDQNFAFVFEDVPNEEFERKHPEFKDLVGSSNLQLSNDWHDDEHTRVCEYYRRRPVKDRLIYMVDPKSGKSEIVRASVLPKEILEPILEDPQTKVRDVTDYVVEWFKIAGDQIIDRRAKSTKNPLPNTMIPIVRIDGELSIIDGQMDCKGHVRNLKDPGRMYNYFASAGIEYVALQSKSPYIAAAAAIEGYETYYSNANKEPRAVLPFNHMDDAGNKLDRPQRDQPPVMAQGHVQAMALAEQQFRMASGQYQEDLGEGSNARSGIAINQRQRSGDLATYHFVDNQAIGIEFTGRLIIELIPKIYDTPQVIKILGQDGIESAVRLDPNAQAEYKREEAENEEKVRIIFNPSFAQYSVQADIGPAYATRRQEAFNAFTQLLAGNPELVKIAGDLMFKAADFPMADELAARLKRLVPPEVLGKGPSPQVKALLQENAGLKQQLQKMMIDYTQERLKRTKAETDSQTDAGRAANDAQVDRFNAETDRMKVLKEFFPIDQIVQMTAQLVVESLRTPLVP